ncbi:MAG: sugar phosphate nucleotidyltransferase [Pygmaiobacter sp.]
MKLDELLIEESKTVLEAMRRLDETGHRILFVAPEGKLRGVVTDSDVRRHILRGGELSDPVLAMANYSPKSVTVEERSLAKKMLLEYSIDALPVLDKRGVITDVIFEGDLDVDTHKTASLPVVIMAGGLGTRLYPYTKILPKPLIPVGELPIAEHIINRFHSFGCNEFHLVVNYKKSMIKSYFNDLEKEYSVRYVDEDKPLGTGGGLALLKGTIRETFFLTNCDVLVDADFGDIYEFHKKSGNLITVICAFKHITIPYGVIELGSEGEIKTVTEKPQMNFLTNTGVYVVEPRVIDELANDTFVGFPDIMERYRHAGEKVGVYPVSENSWMDMGQLEELEQMRRRIENQ